MRKLSETMQYITPRKEFIAESRQSKRETETETETQTPPQSATTIPTQIQENAQVQVQAPAPAQSKSDTIPPCPKSLDIAPSDLLDDDEKVLKFDAFVNECLNKENIKNKWSK